MSANMLGQFNVALQELVESGAWDRDVELEVKIAGTLKNDKFIVIKNKSRNPVVPSQPNPDLIQKHPYQGETK